MQGFLDRAQLDQALVNARAVGLDPPDVLGQVVQVVGLVGWELDLLSLVEVEVLLRAVVREMRGVESHGQKEGLLPFLSQLVDRPLGSDGVCKLALPFVGDGAEFHESAVRLGGPGHPLVGAVWTGAGKGDLVRPRIHGVSRFALALGTDPELVPAAQVDRPCGVMEEFARSHGPVAGLPEAPLEGKNFRVVHEVKGRGVASRCGGELAGEDGGP